ncbi:MAG: hypothetical protein FK734_18785 [Asgard group archaeon]|nr:hypothetical protein [Asgard group archaeon]
MFVELMDSTIKIREMRIREALDKNRGSRGRKRSKKTVRVQELILDLLFVKQRLMRSSEIRIAVAKRVKGLSNYLFFSALQDLQKNGTIIKKKNLLNMKYTFYTLSMEEKQLRERDGFSREQISGSELNYIIPFYITEKDLVHPTRYFWF